MMYPEFIQNLAHMRSVPSVLSTPLEKQVGLTSKLYNALYAKLRF